MKTTRAVHGRSRRGLVLVAAVGILGVLSVMGLAFATVMRLEARAARNYTNSVRAEFVARAGIEDAITRLRSMTRDGTEAPYDFTGRPAPWYTWRGTAGGGRRNSFPANEKTNCVDDDGDGRIDALDSDELVTNELSYTDWTGGTLVDYGDTYTLRVEDAASKINVNAGDNLGVILDNLCRVVGPPLVAADEEALVPKWFTSKHEYRQYGGAKNAEDSVSVKDLFYRLDNGVRPVTDNKGVAVYGDGYAIAGLRARKGAFLSVEDIRNGLTWVERGDGDEDGDPDGAEADCAEERMEIEAKYAALREHITIDSWVDTDQIGYGKFEHVFVQNGRAIKLVDRNKTWNTHQNDGEGELKGCFVAIVNGVGQGQLKSIARNTIDTIILDNSVYAGSEMRVPPNHESSYVVIGKDHRYDANAEEWRNQAKLYARQPMSFHRAPVNANTATDKVLTSLLLGLQTNWGHAGYGARIDKENSPAYQVSHAHSSCPSVLSVGRDANNALFRFELPCPNDSTLAARLQDQTLASYGHVEGQAPFCFMCNYGRPFGAGASGGNVGEAHYLAWQILKEREQTSAQDRKHDNTRDVFSNGNGPFKGWDDLYFRVFRPWERGDDKELSVAAHPMVTTPRAGSATSVIGATAVVAGHPGIARLCMANFNSNTDILKFQPNIEWINRWGANFTELYLPRPDLLLSEKDKDVKLRVRPGELLDKSDLNVGTTEFSFDSGGVYEVESVGRVYDASGVVAERRYSALVRIYDVWRESTQREFVAGKLTPAEDAAGTQRAGQVAADQVSAAQPGGSSTSVRKSLCTYPEPIVPGDHRHPDGAMAPLALDRQGMNVKPAGFDGQIMLATNMLMNGPDDKPADDDVSFYASFTGQVNADFGLGDRKARIQQGVLPLDEVGLLGAVDSNDVDLEPIYDRATQTWVEGEGRGGDLRPDGVYMGVTKYNPPPLDGSFEFDGTGNIDWYRGTVSMWVKPNWHHGTRLTATLPVEYLDQSKYERGSTVLIKEWGNHWKVPSQVVGTQGGRGGVGYVRERFEHEFFNAAVGGDWWFANGFNWRKNGDKQNTTGDKDMPEAGVNSTSPFGAMHVYFENAGDQDFTNWIPGWTVPSGKPFYQICPFRWFFVGLSWNYSVPGRGDFDAWGHAPFGQLREESASDALTIQKGGTWDQLGREDCTADEHVSLVMTGRVFVDTMHNFEGLPGGFNPGEEEQLEAWAHSCYGGTYQWGSFPFGTPPPCRYFGINRAMPQGLHFYQSVSSGTYATVDEFTVSKQWRNVSVAGDSGFGWPSHLRKKTGRYYLERDKRNRPDFLSQTLLESEMAQSDTFDARDSDEPIELGCVRWYAFTPFFALHIPGKSEYEFPYESYFIDSETADSRTRRVSQSTRYRPCEWERGPQDRKSSQRGITVSIIGGRASPGVDEHEEHMSPEAWDPIIAKGGRTGQHARSTPGELRYRVHFGWSDQEYRDMNVDTIAVDSPVFDDITITYMRRPKILVWRDVSQ